MMADSILQVRDLSVFYNKVEAVSGISLELGAGQIVSVIGPNGAGKSSALNAIMGIQPANATVRGNLLLKGQVISTLGVAQRVAEGLSLVPERRELFSTMSVLENLTMGAQLRRRSHRAQWLDQLDYVFGLFPRLKERQQQVAGTMSGGERQMLALGRALMAAPKVLMLDEPSLGLAPLVVREVLDAVASLRNAGVSVLLVEQNARAALQISDYAYVMEGGTISMHGIASELAHDERLISAYLGGA